MHICSATAGLIRDRGLQAGPPKPLKKTGPVTLHQALRLSAGLHPSAWLGAYVDYRETTAAYSNTLLAVQDVVTGRVGRHLELTLWAGGSDADEVVEVLDAAAAACPGAQVPEPSPRLRPGCDPAKRISSVRISGVLVAMIRLAVEATPGATIGSVTLAATDDDPLNCSNEAFLGGLDALVPRERLLRPDVPASAACDLLAQLAAREIGLRVPQLVVQVADASLNRVTDEALALAVEARLETEEAQGELV